MQKNCPKCRNKEIKLNGKNSQGKQKYKCKKCSYCFVRKDRKNDEIRGTSIFYNRIKEGYSVRQLSDQNSKKKHIY